MCTPVCRTKQYKIKLIRLLNYIQFNSTIYWADLPEKGNLRLVYCMCAWKCSALHVTSIWLFQGRESVCCLGCWWNWSTYTLRFLSFFGWRNFPFLSHWYLALVDSRGPLVYGTFTPDNIDYNIAIVCLNYFTFLYMVTISQWILNIYNWVIILVWFCLV